MSKPKYPDCVVKLMGENGNAIDLVSKVRRAIRVHENTEAANEFTKEALSGDYDHVLATCEKWVTVI